MSDTIFVYLFQVINSIFYNLLHMLLNVKTKYLYEYISPGFPLGLHATMFCHSSSSLVTIILAAKNSKKNF